MLTVLQQHSLRSLRKTLLAFRAAAHMSEEDADQGSGRETKYSIDSAQGELRPCTVPPGAPPGDVMPRSSSAS